MTTEHTSGWHIAGTPFDEILKSRPAVSPEMVRETRKDELGRLRTQLFTHETGHGTFDEPKGDAQISDNRNELYAFQLKLSLKNEEEGAIGGKELDDIYKKAGRLVKNRNRQLRAMGFPYRLTLEKTKAKSIFSPEEEPCVKISIIDNILKHGTNTH